VKAVKMAFIKSLRKLIGWCPMRKLIQKERQEDCFSDFKLENRNIRPISSPVDLHENRIPKVRVSLFDFGSLIITFIVSIISFIISFLIWAYVPEDSFLIIFSGLVMFLIPLIFFLNRPNAAAVMSGKIIIKRPLRKPIVVEKEDIRQISITKNRDHSLRWLIRSFYVIFLPFYLGEGIIKALRNLERSFPDYIVLSLFLVRLAGVAIFLALFYNFELLAPYQQTFKVTTNSNLKLWLYTEKPEEFVAILKNETG
jgi:magnesium-transporting ATPase (P-type)